ncbi:hypothetical protein GBA52_007503 [Prunus armeniaca]|nr:hypothetical protein GBA52_007503 [Prunus armeniaca]
MVPSPKRAWQGPKPNSCLQPPKEATKPGKKPTCISNRQVQNASDQRAVSKDLWFSSESPITPTTDRFRTSSQQADFGQQLNILAQSSSLKASPAPINRELLAQKKSTLSPKTRRNVL